MRKADPAGLGRGPLTRWLPVLVSAAPEPPSAQPYRVGSADTPGRFLARVIFSIPGFTVPAMIMATIWQVGESAVPVVTGAAIDRAVATGDVGQLLLWVGMLAGLYIALTAAARLTNRLNVYAVQLLQHRLRATLSSTVLHPVHGRGEGLAPDGGVVSTMTNDVERLSNTVLVTTLAMSRIASIGFIAVSMLALHWLLGVLVLVGAPVVMWLTGMLSRRLARSTRDYQNSLAATVARAADLVAGYRVIKGIRAEAEATARYEQVSRETLDGARRNAGLLGRFQAVSGLVNGVFIAAVTGLAGWFAVDGRLSLGGLIATVGLTQALLPQIHGITALSIPNIVGGRASAARILDTLRNARVVTDERDTSARPGGAVSPSPRDCVLEIRVSDVMCRVVPGELVGIRADDRTGARIADALLNPYAPDRTAGGVDVRLCGHPADELAPAEYRARVIVAPHRTTLFTGTIRENLTTPAVTPTGANDRLNTAVIAAACDDFAADLDAPVGENGNRLSGGQRQRVALARALATDAPVLVLHEPTTAVDSVTEHVIATRLRSVRAGRSTLLIASSPGLLGYCDRIIELHAERTTPDPTAVDPMGTP